MYKRKRKPCPGCGEPILLISNYCRSCFQKGNRNPQYKDGHACKNRFCKECGERISSGSIKGYCSKCYAKSRTGESNPNFRNGHYIREFYNSKEYKNWKLSIFDRDSRICQVCGKEDKGHTFHAHHIYPKRDFPKRVYDIDNGVTVCPDCHKLLSGKEYEFIEYFEKIIMAVVKLRELGEPCDGNTEPSQLEGVETRDEIKFSTSTGQPFFEREDIVRTQEKIES